MTEQGYARSSATYEAPSEGTRPAVRADWRGEGVFLSALVAVAVVLFWRLALTNLIVGRGDLFFYFYPYRDYASAAARVPRVPLWNPYLFMGVPFLANSQAGFFYPFNLVLAWLPVERLVNASILLHAVIAAIGAYLWGRAGLGLTRPGAWLAGLLYGLGGYFVAQVEHLNQIQVLAWLPWLLWLFQWRADWGGFLRAAGMALIIALQLLAGHTQSVFISLVGLAAYAWAPPAWEVLRRRTGVRPLLASVGIVAIAALVGAGLAAVQIVPTFELSQLSVRGGGLPFKEALSFSLRPGMLGRALLPGWDAPLFPEFVAYVGVSGLALAVAGGVSVWKGTSSHARDLGRRGGLVLAALGLFLALGGYNPVYLALVKLVPGFDLFRAPARWLALYTIGMAGLAGIGLDRLVVQRGQVAPQIKRAWVVATVLVAGLVAVGWLLGGDQDADLVPPLDWLSVAGWLGGALLFGSALYGGRRLARRKRASPVVGLPAGLLVISVLLELLGAGSFLPVNRATAPEALTSLRPSIAHLLVDANDAQPGPPARFLSISDIFFDPGDKPESEIILSPQLSPEAVYDYLIATKQKEVLIPNLPLYYRLPAMDGYDGGVLPLRRYATLERLFMPEEEVALDGRLRENLDKVPDATWLSLFNVGAVVTDKVGDAWFDDVFYDLQMGARLGAGERVAVGDVPPMTATALGVVYRAAGAAPGALLAEVTLQFEDGGQQVLTLVAPAAVGEGDQVARLRWPEPATAVAIEFHGMWDAAALTIRGASLIDERTGAFRSLVLSDSGRYRLAHSGDVKIYENLDVRPRLLFVPQAVTVPDDEAALAVMGDAEFDPFSIVVLAGDGAPGTPPAAGPGGPLAAETTILSYEPERVVASVTAPTDGWLFLSDAWYPGWEARVDGHLTPVERADILFRAVAVPAGTHQVELFYRPRSFRIGAWISAVTLGLLVVMVAVKVASRRSRSPQR